MPSGDTRIVDADTLTADVSNGFEIFTILDTYYTFAGNTGLGMHNNASALRVYYSFLSPETNSWYRHSAGDGLPAIVITAANLALDAKVVGHEYGHFCADQDGFLNKQQGLGAQHTLDENQRLMAKPSATPLLTTADALLAFNEGYADWFAVSGAVHGATAGLSGLPGFNEGGQTTFDGYDLAAGDNSVGRGEDEELSTAAILWALESDPICTSNPNITGYFSVNRKVEGISGAHRGPPPWPL